MQRILEIDPFHFGVRQKLNNKEEYGPQCGERNNDQIKASAFPEKTSSARRPRRIALQVADFFHSIRARPQIVSIGARED